MYHVLQLFYELLLQYYIGQCSLSGVYLIYVAFCELLALLLSSGADKANCLIKHRHLQVLTWHGT
jgi:hypothetical protein